jgi:hypothetical protein
MKKFLKKTKQSIMLCLMLFMMKVQLVSAAVGFNEAQAKEDIKRLLNPISNVLLFVALPLTGASIGLAYIAWNGKDEEEKESMPFTKVVKKHIIAFVLFGLSGAMLKWFSIS